MYKTIVLLTFCILFFSYGAPDATAEAEDANDYSVYEPLPNAYLFEDFNDTFILNWNILNEAPLYWSLETVPGALTITTHGGTFERYRTDYNNVFLINFPIAQTEDFQLTTCISNYAPHGLWNQAGLVIWNDDNNYVKLAYEYGEGPPPKNNEKLLFSVEYETQGYPYFAWYLASQVPDKTWLRIVKRGLLYELYNSTDGETFESMRIILPVYITDDNTIPGLNVPVKYIGLFANSGGSASAPIVSASFEFIEFKILPKETSTDSDSEEN